MEKRISVRTSEADWLERAVRLHLLYGRVELDDGAQLGLPADTVNQIVSLIKRQQKQSFAFFRILLGGCLGMGLSAMGLWIIHEAVIDADPTKDLWVLLVGGVCMSFFGGVGVFMRSASAGG